MSIENKGRMPSNEGKSAPFVVSRDVEYGDQYGNPYTEKAVLEVDSEASQKRAEVLLDRFGWWISLKKAVELATADSATFENWVQTDLIPRRAERYEDLKDNWDSLPDEDESWKKFNSWEDYYGQEKLFWEKAGFPLE